MKTTIPFWHLRQTLQRAAAKFRSPIRRLIAPDELKEAAGVPVVWTPTPDFSEIRAKQSKRDEWAIHDRIEARIAEQMAENCLKSKP